MDQAQASALLIKSQAEQIRQLSEANAKQAEQLTNLQQKIDELLSQIARFTRQFYGRKSEKLSRLDPNQLNLFETPQDERKRQEEIEAERIAAEKQIEQRTAERKKARSNRKLLEGLPVIEVVIEPEDVDRDKYKCIGEERTRTLEFEPGKLYVKEIVRPKYGLKDNLIPSTEETPAVIIAPLPLLPVYKGLPGAGLLSEILLQKYEYHLPFYRQIKQFHHLGVKIPANTLSGWFKPTCELLSPLYKVLKEEVLDTDYIQVDETTLPVINKDSHYAKKEYLWMVRSVMKKLVFFHYDEGSRSGETACSLLKSFEGYLQSDGFSAYNVFESNDRVCLVSCMAHIRRRYETALDENKTLAEYALKQIQQLYRIERMADEQNLSFDERRKKRNELAGPILLSFEKWMEKTYPTVLPKSRMGEAIGYSYALWPRMKNYLKDGRLKIDNNLAENAIRPIAVSRKNFLFCGNHEAAQNTAVICSLLTSCKESGVNPGEWLNDVISKMPYLQKPGNDEALKALLPNRWEKEKSNNTLIIR
jgi:Transposase and inactivated derivatives